MKKSSKNMMLAIALTAVCQIAVAGPVSVFNKVMPGAAADTLSLGVIGGPIAEYMMVNSVATEDLNTTFLGGNNTIARNLSVNTERHGTNMVNLSSWISCSSVTTCVVALSTQEGRLLMLFVLLSALSLWTNIKPWPLPGRYLLLLRADNAIG